jgi:hypothetical protein
LKNSALDGHPIQIVESLQAAGLSGGALTFSRYIYRPQSPFDERETFKVQMREIDVEWLEQEVANLSAGWELALNSTVETDRGRTLHIPMIDFSKSTIDSDDLLLMRRTLGASIAGGLVFFDSGRSFHAYGTKPLEPAEWRKFMGTLLLLNLPGADPLVDSRWVGHRLISGYSALRWSSNTSQYRQIPRRVSTLTAVARQ